MNSSCGEKLRGDRNKLDGLGHWIQDDGLDQGCQTRVTGNKCVNTGFP